MTVVESLRVALRALAANKLRTALTMLGIIIGVGAVIALMSIGRGAQVQITASIESLGTNLLFIRPGATAQSGVRTTNSAATLTLEDAEAIATSPTVTTVVAVAPELGVSGQLIADGQNVNARILGITEDYHQVRNLPVAMGDPIERAHVDSRSTVVVLGSSIAQQLFGGSDPVGRTVKVSVFGRTGVNFRVAGVLEPKGGSAFTNQDEVVLMPITTVQSRLFGQRTVRGLRNVSVVNVQVVSEDKMDLATQEIAELLRERHRVAQDDFTIQSQRDFLQVFSQITGIFTMLLGSIAGISLVVGGIGIMNIMLVSVTERTREIGIRKAVGAKRRDILTQFLVESIAVSIGGGALGVVLGWGVSRLIAQANLNGQQIMTVVGADSVALAFGVAAAIGLFFGIYPAMRAARLNPIEALRYE